MCNELCGLLSGGRCRSQATSPAQHIESLTLCEKELRRGVIEGNSGKQIASDLSIRLKTADVQRASVKHKLRASSGVMLGHTELAVADESFDV
ncbi:LuxR C-terminal-related transcriptional regulator [Burkholderia cenocepacia]|uniref:LuxR C-terminal-related transcriptional regulator n=1 Tax=Burkholderia cenocepacia TaxID=95486 RepID=UPI0018ACAAA3|nr:LuxR C-terminal-related transcriptional regulator [Burkholderia cenocepacia]